MDQIISKIRKISFFQQKFVLQPILLAITAFSPLSRVDWLIETRETAVWITSEKLLECGKNNQNDCLNATFLILKKYWLLSIKDRYLNTGQLLPYIHSGCIQLMEIICVMTQINDLIHIHCNRHHDFPSEPHVAFGDLPVSTPELLGTTQLFLLTLPLLGQDMKNAKQVVVIRCLEVRWKLPELAYVAPVIQKTGFRFQWMIRLRS